MSKKREELLEQIWAAQDTAYDLMSEYDSLPHSYGENVLYQAEAHLIDRIALHLTEHPEITALFAFQYPLAVAADQAARRIGRTTGKDLSILCFDSPLPLFGRPQFTHLHQDEAAIGEKAVELLLELISHPVQAPQNVKIPAKLVEGDSFFTL